MKFKSILFAQNKYILVKEEQTYRINIDINSQWCRKRGRKKGCKTEISTLIFVAKYYIT